MARLEIEDILDTWKSEREGSLQMADFEAFCRWYGIDIGNLAQYFVTVAKE